jgi:hypothetical protein
LNLYLNLLEKYGWMETSSRDLNYKIRIRNGYRTALVFQADWYRELIDEFGPPLLYEDIVEIPRLGTKALYSGVEPEFSDLLRCLTLLMEGFGLPAEQRVDSLVEMFTFMSELGEGQQKISDGLW